MTTCCRTAIGVERVVRDTGAVPATVAVLNGKLTVGESVICCKAISFRASENNCYWHLFHITYKDHITNEAGCSKIQTAIDLLTKGSYGGMDML